MSHCNRRNFAIIASRAKELLQVRPLSVTGEVEVEVLLSLVLLVVVQLVVVQLVFVLLVMVHLVVVLLALVCLTVVLSVEVQQAWCSWS